VSLRQRLYLVLAVLAAVTVVANGFSFLMFLQLAEAAGKLDPKLLADAQSTRNWMILVIVIASLAGLAAFVMLARLLLNLLGGEPQYAAEVVKQISAGDLSVPIHLQPGDQSSLLAAECVKTCATWPATCQRPRTVCVTCWATFGKLPPACRPIQRPRPRQLRERP